MHSVHEWKHLSFLPKTHSGSEHGAGPALFMEELSPPGLEGLGGKVKACRPEVLGHAPRQRQVMGQPTMFSLFVSYCRMSKIVGMDSISSVGVSDC